MKSIALIGFMGTGKSTIGPMLAERLGMSFVETDALIEETAKKSIERIFSEDGEPAFRELERSVIQRVSLLRDTVISCGGGATIDQRNLRLLRMCCRVILLTADPNVLFERISQCQSRPLAKGITRPSDLVRLLEQRRDAYADHDFCADTGMLTVQEVVDAIVEWVGEQDPADDTLRVPVFLGNKSYSIVVGSGLLSRIGTEMRKAGSRGKVLLFSNDTVDSLYGQAALIALSEAGFECSKFLMADGESYKTLETAERAYAACNQSGLERRSSIVALGGGVVGDVAGFVAGTYMRGIGLVQVPTTLLAMVDSSVGGKTAVNMPFGKNMVGVFHQPHLVVADHETLETLPLRDYRAGMVELIKHGLILNAALLDYLVKRPDMILRYEPTTDLTYAIAHSCAVKAEVVESDETDMGRREILNVGHTVGHALELACGYGRLRHGEAVALGLLAETTAANMVGLASDECLATLKECLSPLLKDVHLSDIDPATVCEALESDKKKRDGKVKFSVLQRIGSVRLGVEFDRMVLQDAIAKATHL